MRAAAKPGLTVQFTNADEATEFLSRLSPGFKPPNDPDKHFRGIVLGASLDFGSPRGFLMYRGSGGGLRLESRSGYFLELIETEAGLEAPLVDPIDFVAGLAAPIGERVAGLARWLGDEAGVSRLAQGPWRLFGNNWKLLLQGRLLPGRRFKYGALDLIYSTKSGPVVRGQYWRAGGGAAGKSLQDWFFMSKSTWAGGFRNGAWNHLEVPLAWNSWASDRKLPNYAMRFAVGGTLGATGYGAYKGTRALIDAFGSPGQSDR